MDRFGKSMELEGGGVVADDDETSFDPANYIPPHKKKLTLALRAVNAKILDDAQMHEVMQSYETETPWAALGDRTRMKDIGYITVLFNIVREETTVCSHRDQKKNLHLNRCIIV